MEDHTSKIPWKNHWLYALLNSLLNGKVLLMHGCTAATPEAWLFQNFFFLLSVESIDGLDALTLLLVALVKYV